MIRMVSTLIVGWVIVVGMGMGAWIFTKLDMIPSHGVLILISSIMIAGTITLLVGMIGTFIIYVEHKLGGTENDVS
jgi:hypothetical protein